MNSRFSVNKSAKLLKKERKKWLLQKEQNKRKVLKVIGVTSLNINEISKRTNLTDMVAYQSCMQLLKEGKIEQVDSVYYKQL